VGMEVLTSAAERRLERGITLIETLAAILILGLVAVAVMGMFTQGMALNATGMDYTELTNMAKDKSEELLSLDYHNGQLMPDTNFSEPGDPLDPVQSPLITWRVAEHIVNASQVAPAAFWGADPLVSTAPASPQGNLKVITVTVASRGLTQLGRRDITVIAIKTSPEIVPTALPTPGPTPTPGP